MLISPGEGPVLNTRTCLGSCPMTRKLWGNGGKVQLEEDLCLPSIHCPYFGFHTSNFLQKTLYSTLYSRSCG